jgi:glycosyltransferase involved in cell wall biosynthesis
MTDESETRSGERLPSVCVVTQPLGAKGETATRQLMNVLSAVTSVALVAAAVPESSSIRDDHEIDLLTEANTGDSIVVAAARFALNQVRMGRILSRRDEEVVLFFGSTSYLLPILWAKFLGKTVVLEPRGDVPLTLRLHWERRVPDPVARLLAGGVRALEHVGYRLSDAIVAYTPSMADELGLYRYERKLYPNGARYVDTDRFAPRVPFGERDQTVGFLGRLDEEKGIRTLASVAEQLPDGTTFRFVGDGDLRGWLEGELADGIERGAVETTGWVDHDDVPDELNRLRLLVLPSRPTEGLPTVVLESLACGTPVYATPVSGTPDVVRDGETGFLVETDDPARMRDEISEILHRENLGDISENGRELIEAEYSFQAAVERYRAILTRVADDRRTD